jgi:hypothetical protein
MRSLNTNLCGLLYKIFCRSLNVSNFSFDRSLIIYLTSLFPSLWLYLMHRSNHLIGLCLVVLCVSAVSVRVTPTGCSGRLNRTLAVIDVRGFFGLALTRSVSQIIGPPSWSASSDESTQSQYACLPASELILALYVDMLILHSNLFVCLKEPSSKYRTPRTRCLLITHQCALATSLFILVCEIAYILS